MFKHKMYSLVLAALLAVSMVLAACGKEESPNSNKGSSQPPDQTAEESKFEFGKDPVHFSFYGNYDWYTIHPWGEDPATKWIKENKLVTVEAIPSGGAATQKFSTMIVSDQLPDVIWGERGADVERLRAAGKLVPLDPYLDKYPNLKKWAGEKTLNMLRSEDGKLYQFPNWYTSTPMGNGGYIINKKIYEELGSPKLETFDDLYEYLKQVKQAFPKITPFETSIAGQGIHVLYTGFAENYPIQFIGQLGVVNGNQLTSLFMDPVFRKMAKYASKLSREKLITQDTFTQTLDQVREKVTSGKVAVVAAHNVTDLGRRGTTALKKKDPDAGYTMIWPLHDEGVDKNKVYPTQYDSLGWNVSVITTAAKNPEGIFAYLDWLTGEEGERIIFWGPEGMYWEGADEEGAPQFTERYHKETEELNQYMGVWDTFQWAGNTSFIDGSKARVEMKLPKEQQEWATIAQTTVAWKTAFDVTEFSNLDPAPESDLGIKAQRINDIFSDVNAKILYAKNDAEVDSILDKAEKDAMNAGYEQLLQYKTAKWQENLSRISGK